MQQGQLTGEQMDAIALGKPIAVRLVGLEAAPTQSTDHTSDVLVEVTLPHDLGLRLRVPSLALDVSDADQDGVFVVTDTFSTVYGEGEDARTAIGDYLDSLFARFLDLEANEAILGPGLRSDLATLRRSIVRGSPRHRAVAPQRGAHTQPQARDAAGSAPPPSP